MINPFNLLVRPARFELATSRFVGYPLSFLTSSNDCNYWIYMIIKIVNFSRFWQRKF